MSNIPADSPLIKFLPFDEAITPPDGFVQHFKDHWWCVHPEKGLVFYTKGLKIPQPQCNKSEDVCRFVGAKLYGDWVEYRFLPSVFIKISLSDCCPNH